MMDKINEFLLKRTLNFRRENTLLDYFRKIKNNLAGRPFYRESLLFSYDEFIELLGSVEGDGHVNAVIESHSELLEPILMGKEDYPSTLDAARDLAKTNFSPEYFKERGFEPHYGGEVRTYGGKSGEEMSIWFAAYGSKEVALVTGIKLLVPKKEITLDFLIDGNKETGIKYIQAPSSITRVLTVAE